MRSLDLSNNHLTSVSDASFLSLNNLRTLELNDNLIEQIAKGTFQGDVHTNLESIALHFNNIKQVQQHTFVDLKVKNTEENVKFSEQFLEIFLFNFFQALKKLQLDDNRITNIERRAFMNLDQLRYLTLRGNKIDFISDEAFQVSSRFIHFVFSFLCSLAGTFAKSGLTVISSRQNRLF